MGFVRLVAFAVTSLLCAGFGFGWLLVMRLLWFLGDFGICWWLVLVVWFWFAWVLFGLV